MSGNVIPVGNTPIFEQLKRDFALRGIPYDRLIADGPIGLRPVPTVFAPGSWMAKPVPRMAKNPVIERNIDPDVLSSHLTSLNHFIGEMVYEFEEKYPDVCPVNITRLDELDGTITIRVSRAEMVEQTDEDVNAVPKPLYALHLPGAPKEQHEYFHVRGKASILPPVYETSIGEDTADALYMKTSTWGSDEE